MATYYIPVSDYYSKAFLVGPFLSKKEAETWLERVLEDYQIDRYGQPKDVVNNLFVLPPVTKTIAKRRFAVAFREGRVISAETKPSFDGLQQAIELQVEYLDATR